MKKMKRLFAILTAVALLFCCIPATNAAADTVDMLHLRGDLDGDGEINQRDLDELLSYLNGEAAMPAADSLAFQAADIMGAGLTMEDARRIYRVSKGYDAFSAFYTKAETVDLFNRLVNVIKSEEFRLGETLSYFYRNETSTRTDNFDFGRYTTAVRLLWDEEMVDEVDYSPLYKNVRLFLIPDETDPFNPNSYRTNFPAFGADFVSALTTADVNSISVTRGTALDIVAFGNMPDQYQRGSASNPTIYDLTEYKTKAAAFTDVLRLEVKIPEEKYSTVKDLPETQPTAFGNLYGSDMRELAANYPYIQDESDMGLVMRIRMDLRDITTTGSAVFYFDRVTLNPLAASYAVTINTEQEVEMEIGFENLTVNGTMDPTTNVKTTYVFFFDNEFGTAYGG